MAASESDQILAQGAPVTLSDGRVLHIRYGMRGIKHLEDAFGSTQAIDEALHRIMTAEGKSFSDFSVFVAAGLLHEGIQPEEVDDLIMLPRYIEYSAAVIKAMEEAFGSPNGGRKGKARNGSRGKAGTTSPPSSSAAPTKTSGG